MRVMKRRTMLAAVMVVTLLAVVTGVSGFASVKGVSADSGDEQEFTFLVSPGLVLDNPLCDQSAPPLVGSPLGSFARCPDMATASN